MYPSSTARRPVGRERNSSKTMSPISTTPPSAFMITDDRIDETVDSDKTWSCEDDHIYPLKDSLVDPWEQCYGIVRQFDEELITGLKDEIGNLLVVASLFLAIVTAFVIESAKMLKPDSSERSADLLDQLVKFANRTSTTETLISPLREFPPSHDAVAINQLWFLSMTQSLAAVVLGTLCLQWLSAFTRKSKPKIHGDALALRQMRYEGLIEWGVPRVPAILLLNVQAALVLFTIGLLWFLWTTNRNVAVPVVIVAGVATFLLVSTTVLPLLQSVVAWMWPTSLYVPQCPFKSPISFILHRTVVLLSIAGSYLVQSFVGNNARQNISTWREVQKPLLTDTIWEYYDELWRKKREETVPGTHRGAGDSQYSRYLKRSLAFVMSTLVAKPSAVHIVHNCLQDIHGFKAHVITFEKLFKRRFTKDEEGLIATAAIGEAYMPMLRKDFLSACVLQYFAKNNGKLHGTVLKHRAELFIRVNNTASTYKVEVGKTLECPITSQHDAASLTMVTRRQFLECVNKILENRHTCSDELLAVGFVMKSIDSREDISKKFRETVEGFRKALIHWQQIYGAVPDFKEIMETIIAKFPPEKVSQEQENQFSEKSEITSVPRQLAEA